MRWFLLMLMLMLALIASAEERAMLGVAMAPPEYSEFARNFPDVHPLLGVPVESVVGGSGVAAAGLRSGDFLLSLDDRPLSLQSEVYRFVSTKRPGDVVRVRYFRPDALSGDGYAERELTLGRWQDVQTRTQRLWFPVEELIERMGLLRQARSADWDGWDGLLAEYDRDFSWLAAEGLPESRRAIECMHDMGLYLKGHESLVARLYEHGRQWPEYALVVAVTRADKGDRVGAEALVASHVQPHLPAISAVRRDFLSNASAKLVTPSRIRLLRGNPAIREFRKLAAYLGGASATQPPNCGWLAGFLDLEDINSLLWRMHTQDRYVPGFEELRTRLGREAGSPHMQDTVAWIYADEGDITRAVEIYKSRVLPFTDDPRYSANLGVLEALLKEPPAQ
ncbi:MAG: hypothetical protein ACI8W8_003089 [Rhodothermales bacterium]|jgi:hypothetical protein